MGNKELLARAKNEILSLRHQNEILSAKNEVINVFAEAMGMRRGGGTMHPDIVHEIDRAISIADAGKVEGGAE